METIISIEDRRHDNHDGYTVTTNKRSLFFGISSGQSCCERAGYFVTPESASDFVGATLVSVTADGHDLLSNASEDVEDANVEFVNLNTDRGTFQLVVYNEHNGYYGHGVVFIETVDGKSKVLRRSNV